MCRWVQASSRSRAAVAGSVGPASTGRRTRSPASPSQSAVDGRRRQTARPGPRRRRSTRSSSSVCQGTAGWRPSTSSKARTTQSSGPWSMVHCSRGTGASSGIAATTVASRRCRSGAWLLAAGWTALTKTPPPVGEPQPGGDPRREPAGLAVGGHDRRAGARVDRRAQVGWQRRRRARACRRRVARRAGRTWRAPYQRGVAGSVRPCRACPSSRSSRPRRTAGRTS